jgi:hypothetical protein
VPELRRSRIRVPRSRAPGGGEEGIGALTDLTATLVPPVGTVAIWPQSGHRTVEPGDTEVTSIACWHRGHFKIVAIDAPLH